MATLTRDQILNAQDMHTEKVSVPEWGGDVFVRTITAGERDKFEMSLDGQRVEDVRASLAALTVCDEANKPLFDMSDIKKLTVKSAAALDRIFDVASRLNKFSKADVDTLGKVSTPGA